MSDSDSFINEVSEEVRRDQLFALFRRWAPLAILVVVGIVGAAAWFEWNKAQERATSEAFGDALLTGLEEDDPEARIAALSEIETATPEVAMILALLAAGEEATSGSPEAAAARLREAAEAPGLPRRYVDLALLKAQMMDPAPEAQARLVLETMAEPGAPYAPLAEEQLALVDIRAGDLDAGLDRLRSIERSAAATAGLQQRAGQLIVALESGAVLVDAPAEEEAPAEEAPLEEEDVVEEDPAAAEADAEANPVADGTPAEEVAEETPAEEAAEAEGEDTEPEAEDAPEAEEQD
jgi:hypothetical protein